METLVKLAEVVLAFILSGVLLWFFQEEIKNNRDVRTNMKGIQDEFGNQKTNIAKLGSEMRALDAQIRSLTESFKFYAKSIQGALESRDIRLNSIERHTDQIAGSIKSHDKRIDQQATELRDHRNRLK